MKDLIERQAAIDAVVKRDANCGIDSAEVLKLLPPAQPDIIRCKDCRKHNVHSGYKDDCCPLYEWRGMSYGHEHDYQYCSYAERREEHD